MDTDRKIDQFHANFSRIFLGGIPSLLNDSGAYLSFICTLIAAETLGGLMQARDTPNKKRFVAFISKYFPPPLNTQVDDLWTLRNSGVHGFSTGPYKLTHHNGHVHLTEDGGHVVLNAEDLYGSLLFASRQYFEELRVSPELQTMFEERVVEEGLLTIGPMEGSS
jgi:hypothetical protein